MPLDSISIIRLHDVCPALADKITTLATMLDQENVVFRVTQGLRSWAQQAQLYAQGRTAPGEIVTNAPPGYSWHEFGLAIDLVPFDQVPPQPDWDISHPVWQRIITAAESLGLFSGSEFHTIKDWPHLQLTGTWPESPNDEVRQLFLDQGMEAVWQQGGLV